MYVGSENSIGKIWDLR